MLLSRGLCASDLIGKPFLDTKSHFLPGPEQFKVRCLTLGLELRPADRPSEQNKILLKGKTNAGASFDPAKGDSVPQALSDITFFKTVKFQSWGHTATCYPWVRSRRSMIDPTASLGL